MISKLCTPIGSFFIVVPCSHKRRVWIFILEYYNLNFTAGQDILTCRSLTGIKMGINCLLVSGFVSPALVLDGFNQADRERLVRVEATQTAFILYHLLLHLFVFKADDIAILAIEFQASFISQLTLSDCLCQAKPAAFPKLKKIWIVAEEIWPMLSK